MDHVGDQGTLVEYGINGLDKIATGAAEKFIDGGGLKRSQYIHRVRKKNIRQFTFNWPCNLFFIGDAVEFIAENAVRLSLRQ